MTKEQFYTEYNNTDFTERFAILDFNELGTMTLKDVWEEIKRIDEEIQPKIEKQNYLLKEVEQFFKGY